MTKPIFKLERRTPTDRWPVFRYYRAEDIARQTFAQWMDDYPTSTLLLSRTDGPEIELESLRR